MLDSAARKLEPNSCMDGTDTGSGVGLVTETLDYVPTKFVMVLESSVVLAKWVQMKQAVTCCVCYVLGLVIS